MEVMHSCRCCLQYPPDRGLTTPYPHRGKIEVYSDMLEECFDLHISLDGNEKSGICEECVGRLRDASDFKLQVQSSQERLQRALVVKDKIEVTVIKTELMSDDDTITDADLSGLDPLEIAAGGSRSMAQGHEGPCTSHQPQDSPAILAGNCSRTNLT